jgi:hypothetical protein
MSIQAQRIPASFAIGFLLTTGLMPCVSPGAEPASTERYTYQDCVLEAGPPAEVGRAAGHFWFPSLHAVQGNDLFCEANLTDDKPQGEWPAALCLSRDGGATWRRVRDLESCGPISVSLGPRKILIMPYETWPVSPGDKRNAKAKGTVVALSEAGAATAERVAMTFEGFPRDLAPYHVGEVYLLANGNILSLKNRALFTTLYGKFAGDTKDSCWAVSSTNQGLAWRFLATVANGAEIAGALEGANESSTCRLADGRLMTVCRTGGIPDCKAYSADDGATWSAPQRMEGIFCVEPQLVRLANGVILLSGGRPGLFVWICTDGEGNKWERLNLAAHHNRHVKDQALRYADAFCEAKGVNPPQSTSYTGMVAVGPDEGLIAYDRLGNGWQGAPGPWGTEDAIFCVRLKVTRKSP